MGLSSSQGRLLMLTSRLSDIEFQEIMISHRQNTLAWKSEEAAKEYNEAISNHKITIKVTNNSDPKGYETEDLNYKNLTSMGYLATNLDNEIYLQKDEEGNWIIPKDLDGNDLLSINPETGKAKVGAKEYDIADGNAILSNPVILQNMLMNGAAFIFDTGKSKEGITLESLAANTQMEYVEDTSDDAQAQSKYEYETAKLSREDNQLDMELQQLETQHAAISKEYDSIKDVINNNVERTFNLFSNG